MKDFNNYRNEDLEIFFLKNLININLHSPVKINNVDEWIYEVENKKITEKEMNKRYLTSEMMDEVEYLRNMDKEDFVYDYVNGEWICFDNYNRDLYKGNRFYLFLTEYTCRMYEKTRDINDYSFYPHTISQDIEGLV